jgi:UDP-N-acetylmuramoyl-tripeptide--D-alanyl-D-alanine ligase
MSIEELYNIYLQYPSVQTDTRKLKKGDLFFALKGPNFNGNLFAEQALESGAGYVIIDEKEFATSDRTILVTDVLTTLQSLAKHHRQQLNIPFIAITGSNGKTTTKELIHAVLSSTYKTYTTEGNFNNHIGVPLTILKIGKDAEIAVIEMGANHLGEIASYCEISQPTHGLITNCGRAHLEGFGDEEGVRKAKGELFDHLQKHNGVAFVMCDYNYLNDMSKGIKEIIQYGTNGSYLAGKAIQSDPYLKVQFNKGYFGLVETNLVGSFNLPNVLAAVTIGKYFQVADDNIRTSLNNYKPSNSRSQLVEKGSNKIILDAYNANPSSMKLAIENFGGVQNNNKILVLGAMAELGTNSIKEHQEIVEEINKYDWSGVYLVGGDFLKFDHPYNKYNSVADAGKLLQNQNIENAYLLIKGSRSTGMEKVLDYL